MCTTLLRHSNVFVEANIAGTKKTSKVGASSFFFGNLIVTVADFSTFSTILKLHQLTTKR
jgi:hypothetical protein